MRWLLTLMGLAILLVTIIDALWTTTVQRGGGPITGRSARWVWSLLLAVERRSRRHGILIVASMEEVSRRGVAIDPAVLACRASRREHQRRLLAGYVADSGWAWSVNGAKSHPGA